jgi:serine/threonine protein phosphatase PrpC/membrane protease YdiL (CAAX protease family)
VTGVIGARLARGNALALGRKPGRMAGLGLVIGSAGVGAAVAYSALAGALGQGSAGAGDPGLILWGSAVVLFAAATEEVFFRGWLQPVLARDFGTPVAILLAALAFSALHVMGGVRSGISLINLFLGGVLFGLLAARTGGIAGAVTAHFAWNWTERLGLGLDPNPGVGSFGALWDFDLAGPALWGGSDEGLNAGIAMTLALLVLIAPLALAQGRKRSPAAAGGATAPKSSSAAPKIAAEQGTPAAPTATAEPAPARPMIAAEAAPAVENEPSFKPLGLRRDLCLVDEVNEVPVLDGTAGAKGDRVGIAALRVETGAMTHVGKVRSQNEDSHIAREEIGLWVVADGMGGHDGGEWASARIVEEFRNLVLPAEFEAACGTVADAINTANAEIFRKASRRGKQMGSTVVALLVQGSRFVVFWVGDSRAYLLRNKKLHRLSRDHSQIQFMIDRGLISAADAAGHPMGHVLARAVGVADDVEIDSVQDEIEPGDMFLLCSDGLHGFVAESEIARILSRGAPDGASEELVALTLDNGAPDNVTVIAVMFTEPTLLSLPESATA